MRNRAYILSIVAAIFTYTGTSHTATAQSIYATQTANMQASAQVPLIEPSAVKSLLLHKNKKITLVDVRRPDEFSQGHIDGALLMPLDTLPSTYSTLPKKGKLIVYCRSGHRSAQAVRFLIEHGYKNAVSMNGGYMAWTSTAR